MATSELWWRLSCLVQARMDDLTALGVLGHKESRTSAAARPVLFAFAGPVAAAAAAAAVICACMPPLNSCWILSYNSMHACQNLCMQHSALLVSRALSMSGDSRRCMRKRVHSAHHNRLGGRSRCCRRLHGSSLLHAGAILGLLWWPVRSRRSCAACSVQQDLTARSAP